MNDISLTREMAYKIAEIINRSKYFADLYELRQTFYEDLLYLDQERFKRLAKQYQRLLQFEEENK